MTNPIAHPFRKSALLAGVVLVLAGCAPEYTLPDATLDRAATRLNLVLEGATDVTQQPEEGVAVNYDLVGMARYLDGLPVLTTAQVACQGIGEFVDGNRDSNIGRCTLVSDDGTFDLDFQIYGDLQHGLRGAGTVSNPIGFFEGADGTVLLRSGPIAGTRYQSITMSAEIVWAREPGVEVATDEM